MVRSRLSRRTAGWWRDRSFRHISFQRDLDVFQLDYGPAHVVTAVRADSVSRYRRAALRAVGQLAGLDRIVGATFPGTGI